MQPGIYYRDELPQSAYDSIDAVNISRLSLIGKSLKHYKRSPKRVTKALALGTAAHAAVLEPERFTREFVPWTKRTKPDEDGKTKASPRTGKEWQAFVASNPGKTIIPLSDYEKALAIRDEIHAEPRSREAIQDVETEVTLVWVDPGTGILCKGRIDWLKRHDGERVSLKRTYPRSWVPSFGDVKTARDISPGKFFHEAAKLHYHTRMAWYADALRTLFGMDEDPETLILAVESGDIHDSVVYEMDEDDLQCGREEYQEWMTKLSIAIAHDSFPGMANETRLKYFIPKFARNDPDDEVDSELDFSKGDSDGD
jgi:PDDEXK-like domain of unknown function (DUF3799)